MKTKARTKATHNGTCQVCGCLQKLPDGVLSIHGYTVKWGFFSGICQGSGHLPFEQDKSLIEGAIKRAQTKADEVHQFQDRLRQPVTPGTTKTWARIYFSGSRFSLAGYQWHEVDAYTVVNSGVGYEYVSYHYPQVGGSLPLYTNEGNRRLCQYERPNSLENCIALCNEARAKAEDRTLSEIAQYIEWQQDRIKNWKPQPLKPIK